MEPKIGSVLLVQSNLHGSWWGKPHLSPFSEEDALCHFWGKPLGARYDAVQELKLQTGDLSDLRCRPKGSVALQGATWLPALTPDVKRTNKIPEWKHGALKTHQNLKLSRSVEDSWRHLKQHFTGALGSRCPGKGKQLLLTSLLIFFIGLTWAAKANYYCV